MAAGFKVGTFTKSTNTSVPVDQAITGVGFQPKALILFILPQTATGSNNDQAFGIGFCAGTASTDVHSHAAWCDHNVSTTAASFRGANKAITCTLASTGAAVCEADLKSFDSDGFTLTWTTNDANAYEMFFVAFGGSDITNVKLLKVSEQSGTGNKAYTGVGFQPSIIFLSNWGTSTNTTIFTEWGAAISSSKRWAQAICVQGGQTMTANVNAQSYQRTDSCLLTVTPTTGAEQNRYDFVSMDSDGFTLNQVVQGLAGGNLKALCIKGGSWDLGNFTNATGTAPVDNTISGLAFQPDGYILATNTRAASTSVQLNSTLNIGAADGTNQCAMSTNTTDATLPTSSQSTFDDAKVGTNTGGGYAVTHKQFNSDGFVVTFNPNAGGQFQNLWVAAKLTNVVGTIVTADVTTDAAVSQTVNKDVSSDAAVSQTVNKDVTTDAAVSQTVNKDVTTDAAVGMAAQKDVSSDAAVSRTELKDVTTDASISVTGAVARSGFFNFFPM